MLRLKERTKLPVCEGLMKLVKHESFKKSEDYWEDFYNQVQEIEIPDWKAFPFEIESEKIKIIPPMRKRRLSSDEENKLFLYYNYSKYRYNKSASNGKADLGLWLERVNDGKTKLVQSNLGLVLSVVKRTNIPGVDFPELVSEGNFALLRAIEPFNVSRGFKFSTYAYRTISKAFNRMATNQGKYSSRFSFENEFDLEFCFHTDTEKREKESRMINDLQELLSTAVKKGVLSSREYRVIKLRYLQDNRQTLHQIEDRISLTPERIRQIERGALEKLREELGVSRAKNRKKIVKYSKSIHYTQEQSQFVYSSMLHNVPVKIIQQELIQRWKTDRTKSSIYENYYKIREKFQNKETATA